MATSMLKTRIKHKIGTASNWASSNLVPLEGELVIYKGDKPQIKVGDGSTAVGSLPFIKAGSDTTITQTITSGTEIGSISIDGVATKLYAPSTIAWSSVTGKPSTYTPSSHTHNYIVSKGNYTFDSSTLPNSFDHGLSCGFVNSDAGFGSYGGVITHRAYSGGGGSLQLYSPYSSTYGGTHLKARFGNYGVNNGNSWTDLKEIAWVSDIPTKISQLTNDASGTWGIDITGVSIGLKRSDNASNARLAYSNANRDSYGWGQIMYDSNNKACYIYYLTSKDAEAPTIRVYGPDGGTNALVLTTANYTSYVPTRSEAVLAISANGYYGMAPSGNTSAWIRTTTLGIIPYQSGGSSALGTSSWPFNDAHINTIYGSLQGNASTATRLATLSTTASFYRGDGTWSNIIKQTSSSTLGINSNLIIGHKIKDLHFDITNGSGSGIDEGNAGGISWGSGNNTYAGIYYQTSGAYGSRLIFATTTTYAGGCYARMIIQNNGYIGINTLSPSYALHVNGTIYGSTVYGAVWNDYAEFRQTVPHIKPGQIVTENGDGTQRITTERLQRGCNVVSDTFGFAIGETDECKTPIACAGRALVYTYENRYDFQPGEAVCSGPNGTVSRMTREEMINNPDCIVGFVSEIPEYEVWGTGNVEVDGRIWIKVK